ncbi:MAG: Fe(3+) ABC transporter substrate-binding protein [Pseudomonadota bacterium]
MTRTTQVCTALAVVLLASSALPALAGPNGEVNLYSSRHYDTDERLYSDFEEETGITINRIEDGADILIERMQAEGANSPADVLITVDAARIGRADAAGLFQPVSSDVLESRIPANLRHPEGHYFGFSTRARPIWFDKAEVENPPQTYADLADPQYEGLVCARSSSNVYQQSLMASIIANEGEEAARAWAEGLVSNFARDPEGGDTDQLRAIVSGQCDIVIANTYYFGRAIAGDVEGLTGSTDMIGVAWPNQDSSGTHVNVSAAGVAANAPNRENAIAFLEYLASDSAQRYFADGNQEYPVVDSVEPPQSMEGLGDFKADAINIADLAANQRRAVEIFDEVGYE